MTTKPTEVVVAVAFDKDGRFLMTSRPEGKVYACLLYTSPSPRDRG